MILILFVLAQSSSDPDQPLGPRYETLTEIAEREAREPFLKPSQLAEPRDEPPAAWARPSQDASAHGPTRGLLDVRGFYHAVSGDSRPDWKGLELLTYVNLHDGLYGAGLFRNEVRDVAGRYFSGMLVGRLRPDWHLVTSIGVGNGADFFPLIRMDASLRIRSARWRWLMVDVGGMNAWFTEERRQASESGALLFWLGETVIEARQYVFVTSVPGESARVNPAYMLVWLRGTEGVRWFITRLMIGADAANRPGVPYADVPDRYGVEATIGYRHWLARGYGIVATVQYYRQFGVYTRTGGDFAFFVHY